MARGNQTRAKRTLSFNDPLEPDQPPPDVDEESDDNGELFPSDDEEEEEEDEGGDIPDYDEAADEATAPFKRDDDPEFREREAAIRLYMKELGFNRSVALSLYRDQGLDSAQALIRLKDETIDKMMTAIRKEDTTIHIPLTAVENFKLLVYYLKHRKRTSRPYAKGVWNVDIDQLDRLSHHRDVELMWDKKNKPPETVPMTIDQGSAAKCLTAMTVILEKFRGHDDVPLTYVIRPRILPPDDGFRSNDWQPPFGYYGSPYSSVDDELRLRAPILRDPPRDLFLLDDLSEMENDPSNYPRCDAFNTDNAQVYRILQSHWGKSPAWSQAKQYNKTKDGRAAYRTIHDFFLGRSQIHTQQAAYNTACQSLRYTGERRGFTFDTYVNKHVEQHHLMDELAAFGPKPPDDGLKIQWFQAGIECDLFNAVRAAITTDRQRFSTFDAVKDAYVDFARQNIKNDNSSRDRRSVSSVNGRGGRAQGRSGPRGRGGRDNRSDRGSKVPSQIEVDKCTHITLKKYPWHEYEKLNPAEKQKLYQLRYPDAKPGTRPSRDRGRSGGSTVSAMSGSTDTDASTKRKRNNDDEGMDHHGDDDDQDNKSANRANARQRN